MAKNSELQLRARPHTRKIQQELVPLVLRCSPRSPCPPQVPGTFGRVEDSIGLLVADVAALGFAIVLEGTALTEVVPTPAQGHRGHCESPDTITVS